MQHEKIPMTVLVQTKNEERNIARCVLALKDFSQVIVVDSHSSDQTQRIARDSGADVVEFLWNGKYPKKKQWQLDNLTTEHDWVLFLDADEEPSEEIVEELREIFSHEPTGPTGTDAMDVRLDYVFAGRKLQFGHRVVKRAILRRGHARFPVIGDIHAPGMGELEGHYQPVVEGAVRSLSGRIKHEDRDPISTWFDRHNRYSDWEAYLRLNPDIRRQAGALRSGQGQLFDRVPLKPLVFFIYSYLVRAGFRDGRPGFDYAFALATYYWQIDLKVREMKGWHH